MPRKPAPLRIPPLDRPIVEDVLDAVRDDIRSMVEGGTYTERSGRFARLGEAARQLSAALGKRGTA